jgi:hypothetical protein
MPFSLTLLIFLLVWLYAAVDTLRRTRVVTRYRIVTGLLLLLLPPLGVVAWAVLVGRGLLRLVVLLFFALTLFGLLSRLVLPGVALIVVVLLAAAIGHRSDSDARRRARRVS